MFSSQIPINEEPNTENSLGTVVIRCQPWGRSCAGANKSSPKTYGGGVSYTLHPLQWPNPEMSILMADGHFYRRESAPGLLNPDIEMAGPLKREGWVFLKSFFSPNLYVHGAVQDCQADVAVWTGLAGVANGLSDLSHQQSTLATTTYGEPPSNPYVVPLIPLNALLSFQHT